jgi:hypothetical protein
VAGRAFVNLTSKITRQISGQIMKVIGARNDALCRAVARLTELGKFRSGDS